MAHAGSPSPSDTHHYASGRPLSGAAAESARIAAERRARADEHLGQFQALAQFMVELHGVDVVRAKLGRDKALKLLALAGLDTQRIAAQWEAAEPVRRQLSRVRPSEGYDRDPRHDPRVVEAILRGASSEEINRLIGEVTDELLARPVPTVGPPGTYADGDRAVPGVNYEAVGGQRIPVQVSGPGNVSGEWDPVKHVVRPSSAPDPWVQFPDHQPGYEELVSAGVGGAGMPVPPVPEVAGAAASAVTLAPAASASAPEPGTSPASVWTAPLIEDHGCQHEGIGAGAKFCGHCGASLTGQAVV